MTLDFVKQQPTEEQKKDIEGYLSRKPKPSETWFLVEHEWMNNLKKYFKNQSSVFKLDPPKQDKIILSQTDSTVDMCDPILPEPMKIIILKPNLKEHNNFDRIHPELFYMMREGFQWLLDVPIIPRKIENFAAVNGTHTIQTLESYPFIPKISSKKPPLIEWITWDDKKEGHVQISYNKTLKDFILLGCAFLGIANECEFFIEQKMMRIWRMYCNHPYECIELNDTILGTPLSSLFPRHSEQQILFEYRDFDVTSWPLQAEYQALADINNIPLQFEEFKKEQERRIQEEKELELAEEQFKLQMQQDAKNAEPQPNSQQLPRPTETTNTNSEKDSSSDKEMVEKTKELSKEVEEHLKLMQQQPHREDVEEVAKMEEIGAAIDLSKLQAKKEESAIADPPQERTEEIEPMVLENSVPPTEGFKEVAIQPKVTKEEKTAEKQPVESQKPEISDKTNPNNAENKNSMISEEIQELYRTDMNLFSRFVSTTTFMRDGQPYRLFSRYSRKDNQFFGEGDEKPSEKGLCGLKNLGNTCFMNSALQCISKIPILVDYFVDRNQYKQDINLSNPHGMHGKMANTFGGLLREMWSGKHSSMSPREFKWTIGKLNNTFAGANQEDSQELISFLLDGLHEDLNRCKDFSNSNSNQTTVVSAEKDPENELSNGELAEKTWNEYLAKNDSFVVDHFHGLTKSTKICDKLGHKNTNFQPCVFLQLAIPKKTKYISVTYIPFENKEQPTRLKLNIPEKGTGSVLIKEIVRILELKDIDENDVVLACVFRGIVSEIYLANTDITLMKEHDDIYAYHLPKASSEFNKLYQFYLPVYLRRRHYYMKDQTGMNIDELTDIPPFFIPYNSNITQKEAYDACFNHVKRFLKKKSEITENVVQKQENEKENTKNDENSEPQEHVFSVPDSWDNVDLKKLFPAAKECDLDEQLFALKFTDQKNSECIFASQVPKRTKMIIALPYSSFETVYYNICNGNVLEIVINEDKFDQIFDKNEISKSSERIFPKKENNLEDCISSFFFQETLSGDNAPYCNKCGEKCTATEHKSFWRVPDILMIHLKRFHSSNNGLDEKIETQIQFPIDNLDMSKFVDEDALNSKDPDEYNYELFAVDNHSGTILAGHYTAFVKMYNLNAKWYLFDDAFATEVPKPESIQTEKAYLLFYVKKKIAKSFKIGNPSMVVNNTTNPPVTIINPSCGSEPKEITSNSHQTKDEITIDSSAH